MKTEPNTNNITTWTNTIVTIVGILVGLSGISFLFFRKYFIEIIISVESVAIVVLIGLLVYQSKQNYLKPHSDMAANPALFEEFFQKEIGIIKNRLEQINNGYLRIYADEVERLQSELIDYIQHSKTPHIQALDITMKPDILLSRTKYHLSNKEFIHKGGKISRILLISDEKLNDTEYVLNLHKVIKLNRNMGVHLGLATFSLLAKQEIQDFIIYDNNVVIAENLQADNDYTFGSSTIYFRKSEVESYDRIFNKIWGSHYGPTTILERFEKCFINGNQQSFNSDEFINLIKSVKEGLQ